MNFVKVEKLPGNVKTQKGVMEERLEKFVSMNVKYAKIAYSVDEYTSPTSCRLSFAKAAKRYNFPVDTKMINGEVYLIRRDI